MLAPPSYATAPGEIRAQTLLIDELKVKYLKLVSRTPELPESAAERRTPVHLRKHHFPASGLYAVNGGWI